MPKALLPALAAVVLVCSAPAVADIFEVHMRNGNMLETRYLPELAPWDSSKVIFLSIMGNRVSLPSEDIVRVVSTGQRAGRGLRLDSVTVLIGTGPNDNLTPEEEAALEAQRPLQQQGRSYNIEQFAEPDATTGLPLNFLGLTTPPLGGANTFGGAATFRRGGGGGVFGEPQSRN